MTQTWAPDPRFQRNRATRPSGRHPICDSQDVSRYKATDVVFKAPALSRDSRAIMRTSSRLWPVLLFGLGAICGAGLLAFWRAL
jgi:hypothetical protein